MLVPLFEGWYESQKVSGELDLCCCTGTVGKLYRERKMRKIA